MLDRWRPLLAVQLLLCAAIAACTSPAPLLYTISAVPGSVRSGAPRVVVVREVSVSRYLERNQIVLSTADYRMTARENDWWAEPLAALIGRVLVEELGQRLPESTVYNETGAVSLTNDAQVEVNIQHMDKDSAGSVVVDALVGIDRNERGHTASRNFHVAVPVQGQNTPDFVAAVSTGIGRIADGIAAMLAGSRA